MKHPYEINTFIDQVATIPPKREKITDKIIRLYKGNPDCVEELIGTNGLIHYVAAPRDRPVFNNRVFVLSYFTNPSQPLAQSSSLLLNLRPFYGKRDCPTLFHNELPSPLLIDEATNPHIYFYIPDTKNNRDTYLSASFWQRANTGHHHVSALTEHLYATEPTLVHQSTSVDMMKIALAGGHSTFPELNITLADNSAIWIHSEPASQWLQ